MSFIADKQTLDDLNIPGRYKNDSISRIYDQTKTAGGSRIMENWFQHPLQDAEDINRRSAIFKYFTARTIKFPFSRDSFDLMERYLRSGTSASLIFSATAIVWKKTLQLVAQDKDYELLSGELLHTMDLLNRFECFSRELGLEENPYREELARIQKIFAHPKLAWLRKEENLKKLTFFKLLKYNYQLRGALYQEMRELISLLFNLDAYIAVAGVARNRGFIYARALPAGHHCLSITDLYHPGIENAKGNSVSLNQEQNVLFLTGANMAGKSTLMKSLGIGIYLAHMGFPVAAVDMEFSVMDGLYTSINVPDNLGMGYSHFYAEVLRVKKVAQEVAAGRNLMVIFDELFKGTNVKDAYDATLSITEAFSENGECFFVISTHIIEVSEILSRTCKNLKFSYLPTVMEGRLPTYTYELTDGVTADRQGMLIIQNEGILDIIRTGQAPAD